MKRASVFSLRPDCHNDADGRTGGVHTNERWLGGIEPGTTPERRKLETGGDLIATGPAWRVVGTDKTSPVDSPQFGVRAPVACLSGAPVCPGQRSV